MQIESNVVEIDESLMGKRRKCNRGKGAKNVCLLCSFLKNKICVWHRGIFDELLYDVCAMYVIIQIWVFGMVERNTRNIFLQTVENRSKATLVPLIKTNVKNTSTIYHDDWSSYRNLHEEGYSHGTVNHTVEFISSDGVCTNTIEGIWANVKQRIRDMHGVRTTHLQTILDEFCFKYMFRGKLYNQFPAAVKETSNVA